MFRKINKNGQFEEFQGVTIISPVGRPSIEPLKVLHDNLASHPLVANHFSILPYESFHMTINNLYVACEHPNWVDLINDNIHFFKSLSFILKTQKKVGFNAYVENKIIFGDVIQLVLTIPPKLHSSFLAFGRMFGIEHNIPKTFHLTLGYRYRDMTPHDAFTIHAYLLNEINNLRTKSSSIEFNPPSLCYFYDMKEFIIWDGDYNPFIKRNDYKPTLFNPLRNLFEDNIDSIEFNGDFIENDINNMLRTQSFNK